MGTDNQLKIVTNTQYPNNKRLIFRGGHIKANERYKISHDQYGIKLELQNITDTDKSSKAQKIRLQCELTYRDEGELQEGTFKVSDESDEDLIVVYFDEQVKICSVREDLIKDRLSVPVGNISIKEGKYEYRWVDEDTFQILVKGEWMDAESIDFSF